MIQNILIIGANSGIASAVARRYAEQGARFFLVARNDSRLQTVATDLVARGAKGAQTFTMDANDSDLVCSMLQHAWAAFGSFDLALVAHGTLPEQSRTETDIEYAVTEFRTNAESVIVCLAGLATRFELQSKGVIAVISSVAGDRGRASNYLYGAAKAAIDTYASGLRARLYKHGVHLITIKPGFVATSMTANLALPERLTAAPENVAKDIQRAIERRASIVYTPWFWRWIMLVIKMLPQAIFKRLNF